MQKLLLLHGALGSQSQFEPLITALSNDFEVISIDFRGHGDDVMSAEKFSIAGFATQVIDFLQENKIEKIAVFGYSMGGYVGLYLARHHPEKIEKLMTFATKWDWNPSSAEKESKMLDPKSIEEKVPKYATYLQSLHGEKWAILLTKTAEMMLELGTHPTLSQQDLKQIQIPVLVGVGDKDAMVSLEETLEIYRSLPNSQLLVLPGTPHPIDRIDAKKMAYQISHYFFDTP